MKERMMVTEVRGTLSQMIEDMQGLAVVLVGLVIKGLDKYQHESGSRLKLPF